MWRSHLIVVNFSVVCSQWPIIMHFQKILWGIQISIAMQIVFTNSKSLDAYEQTKQSSTYLYTICLAWLLHIWYFSQSVILQVTVKKKEKKA